ncbi:MAG: SurA N-terminal domain-containing protein [Alphaproteobacteria bacterium]|nr:SurA N-terminal domain-containing protein [Alphaproteobacteria bacterium]
MLTQLRDASKSWVAAVLIGLLVLSFAIWGINDIFSGRSYVGLASVGDEEISDAEFHAEFQRRVNQLQRQAGAQFTLAQARAFGIDRQTLNEMMAQRALAGLAREWGMVVSDDEVRAIIQSIPSFKNAGGAFDRSAYERALKQAGYSEPAFVEDLRRDVLRQQVFAMFSGVTAPPGMVHLLENFENERRVIDYFVIPPEKGPEITDPGDEALATFLKEHERAFTAPETRGGVALVINPDDFLSAVTVDEGEVEKIYQARKADFITPEKRVLEQIRFNNEVEARAARAEIDAGKSFQQVAEARGLKPEDVALGEISRGDPSVPDAVFALADGDVSAALEGAFGWVIVRILSSTPGSEKPKDEAMKEIREALAKRAASELVFNKTSEIDEARDSGHPLEQIAADLKLPLVSVQSIDAQGRDASGTKYEGPIGDPAIVTAFFETSTGTESDLVRTEGNAYVIVRPDRETPAKLKDLASVREEVLKAYQRLERAKALGKLAEELAAKGKAGSTIEALAGEVGASLTASEALSRSGGGKVPSAMIARQAFGEISPGDFLSAPADDGETYIVARLTSIRPATAEEKPAPLEAIAERTSKELNADAADMLTNYALQTLGSNIDEARLARVSGGE